MWSPALQRVKLEMVQHLHLMILDRHHSSDETVIEAKQAKEDKSLQGRSLLLFYPENVQFGEAADISTSNQWQIYLSSLRGKCWSD